MRKRLAALAVAASIAAAVITWQIMQALGAIITRLLDAFTLIGG